MRALLALGVMGGVAVAAPAAKVAAPAAKVAAPAAKVAAPAAKGPPELWLGVFDPGLPVHPPWDGTKLTPIAHAGTARVLAHADGTAATGEVTIVHALLARTASGTVERGAVPLTEFAYDQRDGDEGVVVLAGKPQVAFVAPSAGDAAVIKAVLLRTDALAGVRRALAGLELAGVDLDMDGKADLVVTYGCAAWFDGSCQARGQVVVARRGGRWVIVE